MRRVQIIAGRGGVPFSGQVDLPDATLILADDAVRRHHGHDRRAINMQLIEPVADWCDHAIRGYEIAFRRLLMMPDNPEIEESYIYRPLMIFTVEDDMVAFILRWPLFCC